MDNGEISLILSDNVKFRYPESGSKYMPFPPSHDSGGGGNRLPRMAGNIIFIRSWNIHGKNNRQYTKKRWISDAR